MSRSLSWGRSCLPSALPQASVPSAVRTQAGVPARMLPDSHERTGRTVPVPCHTLLGWRWAVPVRRVR